jgi:POT family proton-dependent oligopeptide transporter
VATKFDMAQTVENNDIVQLDDAAFTAKVEEMRAANNAMLEVTPEEMAAKKDAAKDIAKLESSRKYFSNLAADKVPAKGQDLKLFSTELYQSINPFWVVLLTPVLVGVWGALRRKNREPSTPTKIALGLLITALSALVMVGAVYATNDLSMKASSWWLIASYGVITMGELCLSPMGLSLVSKLSPPRITALMMGGFFLSISVGNKLAGMLSSLWETMEEKENFFFLNFALVLGAALLLFLMLKWLNGVMKENNVY